MHLIVSMDFGDYKRGDRISDPALVTKFLASHPHYVTKVLAPK